MCDSRGTAAHAAYVLALMEDCDPAADDYLPQRPDLSGEWADVPTPLRLARDIMGIYDMNEDVASDVIDAIADAYETGVSDTFTDACESELRTWLDD